MATVNDKGSILADDPFFKGSVELFAKKHFEIISHHEGEFEKRSDQPVPVSFAYFRRGKRS